MGNWLSTTIKIELNSGFVLLTSDANKETLHRIDKHELKSEEKILLGQIPHHGSFYNHSPAFWRKRTRAAETPIVVSFGRNSYRHPNKTVVNDFVKDGYKVYSTNPIETPSPTAAMSSGSLDMFSSIDNEETNYLEFTIDDSGVNFVEKSLTY